MNGASKILTVSYGTFSCTLEGFDDPFNTMKAIAEYFRDLAAEDRYFGAEPPTPDAAMLHRIAEREIQRRVEAKIQENGVVLRASGDEAAAPAPVVAATAPATAPVVAPVATPVAAETVAPAPAPVAAPSVAPADATATESVVAKLSRLRSEVAAQPGVASPVTTMPTVSFAIPDYLEDEHAEVIEASPMPADLVADALPEDSPALADAPEEAALPEAEPATDDDALLAAIATAPEAEAVAEESTDEEPAVEEPAVEEPVADEPVATDDTPDAVVEQAALPDVDLPESLMAALADSTVGALDGDVLDAADAPVDAEPSSAVEEGTIDGLSDLIADAELVEVAVEEATSFETIDQTAADEATEEPAAAQDVAEALSPAGDDGYDAQEEAVEAAFARIADEAPSIETEDSREAQEEAVEAAFSQDGDEPAPVATGDDVSTAPELRPGAAEKLQRARARVIRIRRSDDPSAEAAPEAAPEASADALVVAPAPAPVAPVRPRRVTASAAQSASEASQAETPAEPVAAAPADAQDDDFEANLSSIFAEVEEDDAPRSTAKSETAAPAAAPAAQAADDAVEGLLSAEDEAELMRELAALRTNDEDGDDTAAAGASAFVLQQESRKGFSGPSADEALGRLMKQTDSEMEGPENKRRQSAIAHLKAAVAATVADRKVTGDKPDDSAGVSRLARYRNDLAMVVKSALPGRGGSEPPKERPAPLVLVSEQRIDKPRPDSVAAPAAAPAAVQPVQPVRPRRVSASGSGLAMQAAEAFDEDDADEDVGNVFGDTQGFEEFVDRVGAVTLEEILEASAAYLAGVEGLDSFSRPQVMHHVGAVIPPGTFQREDGLRGFGTLLRSGRITKLRRGQFVLAEDSPYLAEAKKIAG